MLSRPGVQQRRAGGAHLPHVPAAHARGGEGPAAAAALARAPGLVLHTSRT